MLKGLKKLQFTFCLITLPFLGFSGTYQLIRTKTILVTSFEGKLVKVFIKSDAPNNRLTIKLGHSDSIRINDYRDDDRYEKIRVLDKKFISLSFAMRGGSNEDPSIVLILCVIKSHLHIAFTASSENWDMGGENDENGKYSIKIISIANDSLNRYKLIAKHYEKITSIHHPKKNYETLNTLHFSFDEENKVFYNQRITLNGIYIIDSLTSHRNKNFKSEINPANEIKRHNYLYEKQAFMDSYIIFINGKWYSSSNYHKNHLSL